MPTMMEQLREYGWICPKCRGNHVEKLAEMTMREWDSDNEMYVNGGYERIMACNDCGCIYKVVVPHHLSPEIKIIGVD